MSRDCTTFIGNNLVHQWRPNINKCIALILLEETLNSSGGKSVRLKIPLGILSISIVNFVS